MAGRTISDLSVQISANTNPLAQDLKRAARELDAFGKAANRHRRDVDAGGPMVPRGNAWGATKVDPFRDARRRMEAERREMMSHFTGRGRGAGGRAAGWVGDRAAGAAGAAARVGGAGLERLAGAAGAAGEGAWNFAKTLPMVAAGVIAAELGVNGLTAAFMGLKEAVQLAGELEQTKLAFEVMLGDVRESTEHIADLRRYAATTPFSQNDVIDASKQLIAYGRSATQAMTDIKMLGDVSAAFGRRLPIDRLAYLYGTLSAQQRAYSRDLFQFSNAGIPILRELEKVLGKGGAELQHMVEDGGVSFEHVRQAFVNMTSAGGTFFQMTSRQSNTFLGKWERLTDAITITKTAFGGILIEELGLGEATQDLERFTGRVEHNMERLRPGIRFLGQLTRAGVQVGYEFARAGTEVARLNIDNYTRLLPGLREAGDLVKRMVEEGTNFRLDDRKAIQFAFGFGRAFAASTVDVGNRIGDFGVGMSHLFEMVVRSAREARDHMEAAAGWLNRINASMPAASKFLVSPISMVAIDLAGRAIANLGDNGPLRGRQPGDPVNRFAVEPPIPGISPDRVREEWPALANAAAQLVMQIERERREVAAGRLYPVWLRQTEDKLADVRRRQDSYAGAFEGAPAAVRERLAHGDIPPIRGAAVGGAGEGLGAFERDLARVRNDIFAPMQRWRADNLIAGLHDAERAALAAYDANRMSEERARDRDLAWHDALGATIGAAAVMQSPEGRAANRRAAWGGGLGPVGAFRIDGLPPIAPDVQNLRLELKRQFDPMIELNPFRRQLDEIRSRGLLGNDTAAITDLAWRRKVQEVAGHFGVGQRVDLPSAVEAGTADDARLINLWRTQPQQTTDQLLAEIKEYVRRLLGLAENLPVAPPPRAVRLPGD